MGSSFGGTIKLTGESQYKQALTSITNSLKLMNSEMKKNASEFNNNGNAIQKLSKDHDVLTRKIETQKEKVATLEKALAQSKEETGENSETTKKWQSALNEAEAELNNLEKELKDNEQALEQEANAMKKSADAMGELAEGSGEAGEGSQRLADIIKGNFISGLMTKGFDLLVDAVKRLGQAFVDTAKQSITAYADYEQLVGGVETIFKGSAGKVQQYASEAYMTAGISANQYMEQVTGFSASLIQSLGGDTAKASEYANRAIIDMSDNANKMGTDMSMIQNAYQGFAKQNYTMLDNLKLGYGGTKTEMERLIKDASTMSDEMKALGVTVDGTDMSFGNIVNAISVMQMHLGIAGTTAEEAMHTISGSMNMAKASWTNLIAGFANPDADLGQLLANMGESIKAVLSNLIPAIERMVKGMSDAIMEGLGKGNFVDGASKMIKKLVDAFVKLAPTLAVVGAKLVAELALALIKSAPHIIASAIKLIENFIDTIAECFPRIVLEGAEMIYKFVEGIVNSIDKVVASSNDMVQKGVIAPIKKQLSQIVSAGKELVTSAVSGITSKLSDITSAGKKLVSNAVSAIKSGVSSIKSAGANLAQGVWSGFTGQISSIKNKIVNSVKSIVNSVKSAMKIHSPSQVMADEVGANMALGIAEGFEDAMDEVNSDIYDAMPTEFDIASNTSPWNPTFDFDTMVSAFKQALKEVKVELDDREVGNFVERIVIKEVLT